MKNQISLHISLYYYYIIYEFCLNDISAVAQSCTDNNYKILGSKNSFGADGYLIFKKIPLAQKVRDAFIARCPHNLSSSADENWPKVRSWLDAILISLVKSSWLWIVIARNEYYALVHVSSMNFKILILARPSAELYPTKPFLLLLPFVFYPWYISCVSSPR